MNHPQGRSTYPGYSAAPSPYGWSWPRAESVGPSADRFNRALWAVVAVLGAGAFGASFGALVPLSWPVTLSILAAIVAAVGLLPGQADRGWVVVAAAVAGALDAVAAWATAASVGWALPAVAVLNVVQALAATAALLRQARSVLTAKSGAEADYRAYLEMVRSYQAYAAQSQQPPAAATQSAAGQASAHAHQAASATVDDRSRASAEYEALQAKYAQHGIGAPREQARTAAGPQAARAAGHDPGVPGTDRAVVDPPGYGGQEPIAGDGSVESSAT
jgi:hypothetical protein